MKKRGQPNPSKAPPAKNPPASGAVPADADLSVLSLEVEREKAALLRKKAEKEETENLRAKQLEFSDAAAEVEADEKSACRKAPRFNRKDPRFQKNRESAHPVRALGFLLFSVAILALFFLPAIGVNGKSVSAFDLLKLTAAAKENVAAFSLSLTPAQAALVEKTSLPLWGAAICILSAAVTSLFTARYRSAIKTLLAALFSAAFVFFVCVIILANLAFSIGAVCYGLVTLAAGDLVTLLFLLCFYTRLRIKI